MKTSNVGWVVCSGLLVLQTAACVHLQRLTIAPGTSVSYPAAWAPSTVVYANAHELVSPPPTAASSPHARTLISVEQRRSHSEAVQRLADIASEHKTPATFLQIGRWPAVRLRYSERLPRPDRAGETTAETPTALNATTAIATGSLLVRLDTTVVPATEVKLADQADAIAAKLVSPPPQDPSQSKEEIRKLRQLRTPAQGSSSTEPSFEGPTREAAIVNGGFLGELEVAVSSDGKNVVVASNSGVAVSSDSGLTFPTLFSPSSPITPSILASGVPGIFGFPVNGDPSVAVGASGNFYFSYLGLPDGTTAAGGVTGCAVSTALSTNGGFVWGFAGHAGLCPLTGIGLCSPDQEHLAADGMNKAPGGGDQVYVVWRNFENLSLPIVGPATCVRLAGLVFASISCSTNSAATWSARAYIGAGDHPRVTVGSDGLVYAVQLSGSNVMLHKFNSCASGLTPEIAGFPVTVTSVGEPKCPVAGLDRCDGPGLSSPMIAVDDTNPKHLYLAFAQDSPRGGDEIDVMESNDGGLSWNSGVNLTSASVPARRFMPWVCSLGGTAFVSWYDRRSASTPTAASNDLTDYFQASVRRGAPVTGSERNLSLHPDPQCASGWPFGNDSADDSESCSVQPQLAGLCARPIIGGGSGTGCDFSSGPCPFGEICTKFFGGGKYGDYNGNACGGGEVVSAWTSATPPKGVPPGENPGFGIFDDVLFVPTQVTVSLAVSPSLDPGRFDVSLDADKIISNAGDGAKFVWTGTVGPHQLSVTAVAPTDLAGYTVVFRDDCALDGSLSVVKDASLVCQVSVENKQFAACIQTCNDAQTNCMKNVGKPGGSSAEQCARQYGLCKDHCFAKPTLTVVKRLQPANDPGRFNLEIDGKRRLSNAGDGATTAAIQLESGLHQVGETAASGTSLSDYKIAFSDDCAADGTVTLAAGDEKTCTIINTSTRASLTIRKVLVPGNDPGRFDLQIDGVTVASAVGDGGSTQPQPLPPGPHQVGESAVSGTNLANYNFAFGGDCDATGAVTLAAGDDKVCTITNQNKPVACVNACQQQDDQCLSDCKQERDSCMQQVGQEGTLTAQQCAGQFEACNKGCGMDFDKCNASCR